MPLEVKAVYTVPELAKTTAQTPKSLVGLLRRLRVPVLASGRGKRRLVFLADLKAMAPELWSSLEEAAHLRSLGRA